MKLFVSKESAEEINLQVEGPLAEQISTVLQQEYSTKEGELNNNAEVQALSSSLESAAIDTSILSALSSGVLGGGTKVKYTTIYGIKKSNLKSNTIINLNDNLVQHMKDPRCTRYCIYVHGEKATNIIQEKKLEALTLTLESYSNVKVFHDFGVMLKHITNGS